MPSITVRICATEFSATMKAIGEWLDAGAVCDRVEFGNIGICKRWPIGEAGNARYRWGTICPYHVRGFARSGGCGGSSGGVRRGAAGRFGISVSTGPRVRFKPSRCEAITAPAWSSTAWRYWSWWPSSRT